jgi:hypothetical protein
MSERKLTTRQRAEAELANIERELEFSNFKLKEANEKLAEATKKYESILNRILDINKISFEAMKHLTTLSAGSIVLMVTFLERLFNTNREWISLIGLALICFVGSIACATSSMIQWPMVMSRVVTAKKMGDVQPQALRQHKIERVAFITFLIGIISLVVFALKNLY